jgi:predicted transcriptional regulator
MTNTPFQTMEEVNSYLSGDEIECLVCGQRFPSIRRAHLRSHGLSHDEYRIRFGIPFSRSLTSVPIRARNRERVSPEAVERRRQAKALSTQLPRPRHAARQLAPAVRDQIRKNAEKGSYFSRTMVTARCAICGGDVVTTMLNASTPVLCGKCATPAALKDRAYYWHKKAVAESVKNPIVHPPFETIGEVDDYLSGDTITCLICDARLQRLDKHLLSPAHALILSALSAPRLGRRVPRSFRHTVRSFAHQRALSRQDPRLPLACAVGIALAKKVGVIMSTSELSMTHPPFQTMAEVDKYLSANTIECLICGKAFQRLTTKHLRLMHNLSADDYRSRFGIPLGRSLTSAPSRAKSGAAMTPERIRQLISVSQVWEPGFPRGTSRGRVPAVANQWRKPLRGAGISAAS